MDRDQAEQCLQTQSVILLDIRPLQEHLEMHIPGSRHLNFFELGAERARQVLGEPDGRMVMVYCRSGLHSAAAVQRLCQYGYNAVDLGGIGDWSGPLEGSFCQ